MALDFNLLDSLPTTTGTTSYVSSSITPTGGAGVIVIAISSGILLTTNVTLDVPTWLDGAWTQEIDDPDVSTAMMIFSGKAIGSPSADTVTVDYEADAQTGMHLIIIEVTGQDGTDLVPQVKTSAPGTATSGSVTLDSALAAATSAILGVFSREVDEVAAPTNGETEILDSSYTVPSRATSVQFKINDTTTSASWTSSVEWHGAALEVKAASEGQTPPYANVTVR